jgi:hypothetical protein
MVETTPRPEDPTDELAYEVRVDMQSRPDRETFPRRGDRLGGQLACDL